MYDIIIDDILLYTSMYQRVMEIHLQLKRESKLCSYYLDYTITRTPARLLLL